MGFTRFVFSPVDGLKNSVSFPTSPSSEAAARKQIQDVLDQVVVSGNTLETELESIGGASKIGCTGAHSDIQSFITSTELAGSGSTPGANIITDAMMTTDVKIGSLAAYLGTIKTSIINICNELLAKITSLGAFSGVVWMYTGTIASIPSGWALCDGTNGTPNLSNRFIMGVTTQIAMNTSGGSNTTTLTSTQLPNHTHTGTTDNTSHSHQVINLDGTVQDGNRNVNSGLTRLVIPYSTTSSNASPITTTSVTLNHTFTTNATGSGASYDSRNAYYALAFIMKL